MLTRNVALKTTMARILVVDDDPLIVELLVSVFEQEGFEVQTAQDGHAGLLAVSKNHFDLIFTDFHMPRMTGLELAAAVRKVDQAVPLILLTGEAHALEPEAVTRSGITRVVPKPFKLDELRRCLGLMSAHWPPAA